MKASFDNDIRGRAARLGVKLQAGNGQKYRWLVGSMLYTDKGIVERLDEVAGRQAIETECDRQGFVVRVERDGYHQVGRWTPLAGGTADEVLNWLKNPAARVGYKMVEQTTATITPRKAKRILKQAVRS